MKQWKVLHTLDKKELLDTDKIIKILLDNRSIKTKKDTDEFLNPKLEDVTLKSCDIDTKEVKKALKRIEKAVTNNETIVIFGDYDVDGICGTAILWETLYKYTKAVHPYIPGRFEEGYGLSIKGIDNVLEHYPETTLIITVDNGIVAYEPTKYAHDHKIDVITTDHHVKGNKELDNYATVHTTKLCGTSVAYLLSKEIRNSKFKMRNTVQDVQNVIPVKTGIYTNKASSALDSLSADRHGRLSGNDKDVGNDDFHLELVALATVADLVPLVGPNRTLLKFGLESLRNTKRLGLQMMFQLVAIEKEKVSVYDIGHVIGPRLNAAGRLFSAMDALRLICTKNPVKATELAQNLDATNKERQAITGEATSHAKLKLLTQKISKITFVHHTEYNEGVIGLVASRLVEEYYKPAFVIAIGEKVSKGSARSISGVNIIEMIRSVSAHIVQAGGHPMAAGFTVETEKVEILREALEARAEELVLDEMLNRVLSIDMDLPFDYISASLYRDLQCLAPFGMKNPEPTFLSKKVTIDEIKPLGRDGKHLRFKLSHCPENGTTVNHNCVAFGIGDRVSEFKTGDLVDVVYTVDENTWNGRTSLQLKIKDIKQSL